MTINTSSETSLKSAEQQELALSDERLTELAESCMDHENKEFLFRQFIAAVDHERALLAKVQPTATSSNADTVRIDWLDAQDHIHALQWQSGPRGSPIKTSFYDRNRVLIAEGISLRHAIDAAMQSQSDQVQL